MKGRTRILISNNAITIIIIYRMRIYIYSHKPKYNGTETYTNKCVRSYGKALFNMKYQNVLFLTLGAKAVY